MKAYSYIRWSSAKQTSGDSLRRQTELAEAYAVKHGLTLDTSSFQDHGLSAFKGKNALEGKLGGFLKAIDDGSIDTPCYLLVEHLDRISRADINDAAELFLSITRRGVTVVTLQNEQVFSKASISKNWTELIIVLSFLANAHEESAKKGKRVKEAWDEKRAKMKDGVIASRHCPSWLKVKDDRTGFIVDKKKAAIIKEIFKLSIWNGSQKISQIFNDANDEHEQKRLKGDLPYPMLGPRAKDGWKAGNVAGIVRQPAVCGRFQQTEGDLVIEGYYPVIVSPKDWAACQSATTGRDNSGGYAQGTTNLFSKLARCAYCGTSFKITSGVNDRYLYCRKAMSHLCDSNLIKYEPIESDVLSYLITNMKKDLRSHEMDATVKSRRMELQQEINAKAADVDKFVKAIERSKTKPDSLVDRMDAAQEELDNLQSELAVLNSNPRSEKELKDAQDVMTELFYKLSPRTKKEIAEEPDDPDFTPEAQKELRLKVQTALRRQISNIDIAPFLERHPKFHKAFGVKGKQKEGLHMARINYIDGSTGMTDIVINDMRKFKR